MVKAAIVREKEAAEKPSSFYEKATWYGRLLPMV
jgi:hypothetical protein